MQKQTTTKKIARTTKTSPYRRKTKAKIQEQDYESDSTYLLKLVVFVLFGTLWLKFHAPVTWFNMPIHGFPIGFLVGLLFVHLFEKHQSDRKIWYACLLVVTIICYFVPAGIVI